jgi:hypothetical protein
VNNFFLASGLPYSKAVSVKVRRQDTNTVTELSFHQYNVGTFGTHPFLFSIWFWPQAHLCLTDPVPIISARSALIIGETFSNAFVGSFQFPCSLFPEGGNSTATFDYLLTHYYGEGCAANATNHCIPVVKDVPPLHEPRSVVLTNLPLICENWRNRWV